MQKTINFYLHAVFITIFSCQVPIGAVESENKLMTTDQQPIELGGIHWQRDLDTAAASSQKNGKPIIVLFQEVPGCITCQHFGRFVLNHPLLAEAIETEFEPVLVYNNRKGADEDALRTFNEPAWNNPVVRYLNNKQEDVIPRQANDYSLGGTARNMVAALQTAKRAVPAYLTALAAEYDRSDLKQATFAMHCFWTGEAKIGSINGVVSVRAAFAHSQEVVDVIYDPSLVTYDKLIDATQAMHCATTVYAHDAAQLTTATEQVGKRAVLLTDQSKPASDRDRLHTLRATSYYYIPMTGLQAMKVNAALTAKDIASAAQWLSPRQNELHQHIITALQKNPACLADLTPLFDPKKLSANVKELKERLNVNR